MWPYMPLKAYNLYSRHLALMLVIMPKKHINLGLFIVLLAAVAAIVFIQPNNRSTIKVGVIAPLSGNFALLGERVQEGFAVAEEELKQSGVTNIEVIIEDACDAKTAVSAINKLIQKDKIDILGGSFCVAGFVPVIPILEENKMIGINLAPNPDSVLNHRYIISTNTSIKQKGTELGSFASAQIKAKTAAIIYYNTPLGEDYRKYFTLAFESAGGKVLLTQMTQIDASDFRTELTKIKALNPDIIFVAQLAKPLGNLLKEANELGLKSKILGNSQNEDPTVIEIAGKAAEGFIISSDDPIPRTDAVEKFDHMYKEKYGKDADVFARNAYDSLMLQSQALEKCKKDTECLIRFFHQIQNYEGASGIITIQIDGTAYKPTSFKVVKDGKFIKLK